MSFLYIKIRQGRCHLGTERIRPHSGEKDLIWGTEMIQTWRERYDLGTELIRPLRREKFDLDKAFCDLDEKAVIYRNRRTLKNLRETSLQRNYFSKLEIFTAFECLYKHVRVYLIFENSFWSSSFLPKKDNETTETEWGYWE